MFHHLATDDRDSIINTAFYLSRGYKDTYQMPLSIESEMFRPFENIYIYATIEGCGYYAYCDEKSTFILDPTKIMSDYFTLYILLLYQSYSALLYSEMIAEHLSSDKDGYEKFSSTAMEHIENLSLEIDVFLAKSIYTSVSHVQHQNDFYHYVEKRFRINENYTNLQSSIKSLHSLETKLNESENQRKRNYIEIGVTLLSLMAIISVFDDANDLAVSFLSEIFGFSISGSLIVMNSIVGVVSIIVLGLCFAFFVSNVKSSKLFTKKKEKR